MPSGSIKPTSINLIHAGLFKEKVEEKKTVQKSYGYVEERRNKKVSSEYPAVISKEQRGS
jgi:hypothetical protein